MTAALFAIHADLPREGPGDGESLAWAFAVAGAGPAARILDAGAGPGADIAGLRALAPSGSVHAVDLHPPFAAAAAARHAADPGVRAEVLDMAKAPGPYDFVWCAGAAYFMGIGAALGAFGRALAPGGRVAFSELAWRRRRRPAAARAFLAAEYPGMTDAAGVAAQVAAAGWRTLGRRWLGPAAWAAYYDPLAARLDALAPAAEGDLAAEIAAHRREIEVWRTSGGSFGYLLSVVAPGPAA
ncbi:MAG: class I SAM-dependent methyltransferase [Rhodobacteraceae bacterium]|nr:class I SAM-dependent methyltransferase [Paracoccaceae bacterium]